MNVENQAVQNLLSQNWLFGALYPEEIDQIVQFSEIHSFENWELVIEKGHKNEAICVLLQGSVRLALDKGGPDVIWVEMKAGDMFGEMAWLDGFPASATIQTNAPSLVLKIPYAKLNKFLDANLSVSNMVLRKLAINLASKLRAQSPAR